MDWRLLGYAVACVVIPAAWGVLVVGASSWVERVLQKRHRPEPSLPEETHLPPIDYPI